MRALSIRQPWAWLIVNNHKDIENRTWPTNFRGRIYVHAGRRMVGDDYPAQRKYIARAGIIIPEPLDLGAIIGEVTITGCVTAESEAAQSPWFCGPYGFTLADPVAYDTPIPYRGRLGFFPVDVGAFGPLG